MMALCRFNPTSASVGLNQGVKVGTLGRQNERNSSSVRLAHTSIFGLCFMPVCLIISNYYSLIYSSLSKTQLPFTIYDRCINQSF